MTERKPEIIVFAGPNGSGKSTITRMAKIIEPYLNADDIKMATHCTDLEAAEMATSLREQYVNDGISFTFETVLSTPRNLYLLQKAKEKGYFGAFIFSRQILVSMWREWKHALCGEDMMFPKKKS